MSFNITPVPSTFLTTFFSSFAALSAIVGLVACQGSGASQRGERAPSPLGTVKDVSSSPRTGSPRKVAEGVPEIIEIKLAACASSLEAIVTRAPSDGERHPLETRPEGSGCRESWKVGLIALPAGPFEVQFKAKGANGIAFAVPPVRIDVVAGPETLEPTPVPSATPGNGRSTIEPDLSCSGLCDSAIDSMLAAHSDEITLHETFSSGAVRYGKLSISRDPSNRRLGTFGMGNTDASFAFTNGVFEIADGYLALREKPGAKPVLFRYMPIELNGTKREALYAKYPIQGDSRVTFDVWGY